MEDPRFGTLTLAAARSLAAGTVAPLEEEIERLSAGSAEVLFVARVQGVSGLLSRLDEAGPALPAPVARELRAERDRIGERSAVLGSALSSIATAAAAAGLALVPLKGAILGPLHYRDPSLRPAADLDLLAGEGDVPRWEAALAGLGYAKVAESARDVVFRRPGERVPTGFEERPDNPCPVELHRHLGVRLLGRLVDPTREYRGRLSPGSLPGAGPALLPDDDALLLHLLVHLAPAAVGRGSRLVQLHDLRLLSPTRGVEGALLAVMGEAAWGLSALSARSYPGCLPDSLLSALEAHRAPPARARRWLRRPGLCTGSHERTLLALAELPLCRSWGERLSRLGDARPGNDLLDRTYGSAPGRGAAARLARYAVDRLKR